MAHKETRDGALSAGSVGERRQGKTEGIRSVLYARVSTSEQSLEGFSIDAQLQTLQEHCRQERHIVVREYVDAGISGGSASNRPSLQELLADARNGGFEEVLVWRVSRLARNLRDLLSIVRELADCGVDFRSVTEHFDCQGAMGKFLLQMMGATAELESGITSENVRLTIRKAAEQGRWPYGSNLLGYRQADGRVSVVLEEAEAVRQAFSLYSQGVGLRAVASSLNAAGLTTKKGKRFRPDAIHDILRNCAYVGRLSFQSHGSAELEALLPVEVAGPQEPIVFRELWEAVQSRLPAASTRPVPKEDSPLASLLRCPECGGGMIRWATRRRLTDGTDRKHRYYICGTYHNYRLCHANAVPADKAEDAVAEQIRRALSSPRILQDIVRRANERLLDDMAPFNAEAQAIEKELSRTDAVLTEALGRFENGKASQDEVLALMAKTHALRQELAGKKRLLDQSLRKSGGSVSTREVAAALRRFRELWNSADPRRRRSLLLHLVERITVPADRNPAGIRVVFRADLAQKLRMSNPVQATDEVIAV